ncbi:putative membrane protein [Methanolobus tindarius DSM 2278]|uniref:Putative membrane protein n=1 Tax=Methanolobus tindarius DSM 2278 TaxID=1090322 RepID=W9DQL6_METTI|nr:NINE protein [Methanolobus tindarius]ETA67793.1 putative membrane protein [Methanolobus tindarius DSM 2278]
MESNIVDDNEKYCTKCGAVINKEAVICPKCGVRQPASSTPGSRNKVAAGVLGILLGGLGAHKFYLGQVGVGILYLCFSWTMIPAIIGLVEGIIYLTMCDEDFDMKYN